MASSAWRPWPAARRRSTTTPSSPRSMRCARAPLNKRRRGEEVVFERRGHLGILRRQHLLAADDQRHLAAERREHVDELDAGDARADHDEVFGDLRWRVGVARGEDAVAVGHRPVGNPWSAPRGQHHDVGTEFDQPVSGFGDDLVPPLSVPLPWISRTFWLCSNSVIERASRGLDGLHSLA